MQETVDFELHAWQLEQLGVPASVREHVARHAQDVAPFWRAKTSGGTLRPDLSFRDVQTDAVMFVVDSKWKLPERGKPTGADLKQMFCYHEIFDAPCSMLLYPSTTETSHIADHGQFANRTHRCSVAFLSIDRDPVADLQQLLDSLSPPRIAKTAGSTGS